MAELESIGINLSVFKRFLSFLATIFLRTGRYSRGECLPPLRSSALSVPSAPNFLSIFVHVFESHNLVCIENHFKRLFLRLVRRGGVNTVIGVICNSV